MITYKLRHFSVHETWILALSFYVPTPGGPLRKTREQNCPVEIVNLWTKSKFQNFSLKISYSTNKLSPAQ